MKNPVPERSPCSSVPRIFTTALPDFSKISFTSRLMEAVDDSGDWAGAGGAGVSSAWATVVERMNAVAAEKPTNFTGEKARWLEPERCLITHWRTIQHV